MEQEKLDLRAQVCLLKERREVAEEELKVQSAALIYNAEEVTQQRAEAGALRYKAEIFLASSSIVGLFLT